MNTKKQGDIGLGSAVQFFTSQGLTVSIPLTDSQEYDLIVDSLDGLDRVQVKHTKYKRNGKYQISLTVKGGNKSSKGFIKKLDSSKVDSIFIVTSDNKRYWLPISLINNRQSLSLTSEWDKFVV
jgi:hypothetical protein